jgi:hypothetical protein
VCSDSNRLCSVQGVIVVVPKEVVCADEEYLISIGLRVL